MRRNESRRIPEGKGIRTARLWCESVLLLPVFLVPLLFSWNMEHANTNTVVIKETLLQISTVYLILSLPLLAWADRKSASFSFARLPRIFPALLLALGVYLWFSCERLSPGPRSRHEWLRWLTYLAYAGAVLPYAMHERRFRLFVAFSIASSVLVSGYALSQALGYDFYPWWTFAFEQDVRRVCSTLGNPDYLAGYLVALLPLTAVSALIGRGGKRAGLAGAALLQTLALIFSYSRGGWVATFIAFVLLFAMLAYVNWVRKPVLFRPIVTLRTMLSLLGGAALIGGVVAVLMWSQLSAAVVRFAQLYEGHSVTTRTFFYEGSWAMWRDRPLLGFGLGSFAVHFSEYRDKELSKLLPFREWNLDHAHNEFLEIAAETGLVGLGLYGGILAYGIGVMWRGIRRHRARENLILLGLIAGTAGLLIHNLFTVTLRYTSSAFLLWSFLAVGVGYSRYLDLGTGRAKKNGMWIPWAVLLCTVLPMLHKHAVSNYVGDSLILKGQQMIGLIQPEEGMARYRERTEEILAALQKGRRLAPDLYESYNWLGKVYEWYADYPQLKETYDELSAVNPYFTTLNMNRCITHLKQADQINGLRLMGQNGPVFSELTRQCLEEALQAIEQAIEWDPYAPEYFHMKGRSLLALGRAEEARAAFEKTVEYAPFRPLEAIRTEVREASEYLRLHRAPSPENPVVDAPESTTIQTN